ncbi:MAG: energy-coupling factor transporter transmembrane component T [Cyanobacteriota bacterium]|nr:energy-coupling factor transporter transmembrane component T [Cyanobacteriota bacterium]
MDWLRQMPIGQYVAEDPAGSPGGGSWLRRLDPRLKLLWTVAFLMTPILAGPIWRLALVALLLLVTGCSGLPQRLWRNTVLWLLVLCLSVGVLAALLPSAGVAAVPVQRPPAEIRLLPGAPGSPAPERDGVSWELARFGPLVITRRSLKLGLNSSTLLFTLVQSANLMLLTTPPEDLVWAISGMLQPLGRLGVPVDRLGFTLLLALRFLPLVQEELQNLIRAVALRAVSLKALGWKGGLTLGLALAERLLANLLLRSEQGAESLLAQGGCWLPPDQLHDRPERLPPADRRRNGLVIVSLIAFAGLRWRVGGL